jgi:hypothetical protein
MTSHLCDLSRGWHKDQRLWCYLRSLNGGVSDWGAIQSSSTDAPCHICGLGRKLRFLTKTIRTCRIIFGLIPKKNASYISHLSSTQNEVNQLELKMMIDSKELIINGLGNGPIDAFINGLCEELNIQIKVSDYHQSAISSGSDAQAAAYIELEIDGKNSWGVGINQNTTRASFEAIIVGLSKIL